MVSFKVVLLLLLHVLFRDAWLRGSCLLGAPLLVPFFIGLFDGDFLELLLSLLLFFLEFLSFLLNSVFSLLLFSDLLPDDVKILFELLVYLAGLLGWLFLEDGLVFVFRLSVEDELIVVLLP
jgi:hypothetical protein